MSCHQHRPIKDQERSQTDGCDPEQTQISHTACLWTAVQFTSIHYTATVRTQRYARGFPEASLPYNARDPFIISYQLPVVRRKCAGSHPA